MHAAPTPPLSRPPDVDNQLAGAAAAFARLSEGDRELLSLAAWEGLDAAQIGTVLDCSRNAARIRLHRARRRFARELEAVPTGGTTMRMKEAR